MIKKIISFVVLLVMLCSSFTAFANSGETAPLTGEGVKVYTLSLQNAIDMAILQSADLECWQVNMENYQVQLSSARRAQKDNKSIPVYANQNFELNFVKSGYYVEAAQSQIDLAEIDYHRIISTISYNVTQKYFSHKNAEKMCEIATSALERAKANYEIIKKHFELGTCTELDLSNASLAVKQCEASLEKCQNGVELSKDSLKITLGIDGDCEFVLTDEISVESFTADLESDTQKAMKTRYDVNGLGEAQKLAASYFKTASSLSHKSTTYFSAFTNSITAKYNYTTGVKNIALLIKSAYLSATEAHSEVEIAKEKLNLAQKTYEVNELRYELGMITPLMLSASSDELTAAESAYENALLTERLATEKYGYEISTGIK